jgi:hypothetical protein
MRKLTNIVFTPECENTDKHEILIPSNTTRSNFLSDSFNFILIARKI